MTLPYTLDWYTRQARYLVEPGCVLLDHTEALQQASKHISELADEVQRLRDQRDAALAPPVYPPDPDDWFSTYSGRRVHILSPRPEDIDIADIAHALAHVNRFGGHTRRFYSVAEHSVLVSRLVPPEFVFQGLMHDASEAYLGDVIRPLKAWLPEYKRIEKLWEAAIAKRFGLPTPLHPSVKQADMVALMTERRDLVTEPLPGAGLPWREDELRIPSSEHECVGWPPDRAEEFFLRRFDDQVLL